MKSERFDKIEQDLNLKTIKEFNQTLKVDQNEILQESLTQDRILRISNLINEEWKRILKRFEEVQNEVDQEEEEEEEEIELICELSSLTRDLIVIDLSFQSSLSESIEIIFKTLWFTSSIINKSKPNLILFNQRSIQAISNLITNHQTSSQILWSLILKNHPISSVLIRLIEFGELKIISSIVILLINCIHQSKSRIQSFYSNQSLIKVLRSLLELLDELIEMSSSNYFDLIVSLISKILNLNEFEKFYQSQKSEFQPISKSQLSILKIQDSILFNSTNPIITFQTFQFFIHSVSIDLLKLIFNETILIDLNSFWNLFNGILMKFEMMIKFLEVKVEDSIRVKSQNQDQIRIEEVKDNEVDKDDQIDSGIEKSDQVNQDEISNLIKSCIKIFSNFNLRFLMNSKLNLNENESQSMILKLLISICKLFSALCECYGSIVQDLIRELGGIPWILKFNQFDPDLPYLSEHSIFCIRNLLFKNLKNQNYIESLKK